MAIRLVETDTITNLIEQTQELQRQHWEEIARNKEVMVLAPDVEQYRALEQAGRLFAVIAYEDERIVAYSVNFLLVNLHYSTLLMGQNDLLFVDKAHRGGRLGMRMIQATEALAAKRGARMVIMHAKDGTPLADILPRVGYGIQDILLSKQLPASRFRLFGSFDVTPALADLAANAPMWDEFTIRQNAPGSNHRDTRAIVLRGPDYEAQQINQEVAQGMLECRDWVENIERLPAVRDLCAAAAQHIGIKDWGRVMLVELAPGGHILRHSDQGAYAEHYDRFHLVLSSEDGNTFENAGETIHMQPGELWQFSHHEEHEVFNRSTVPRIHLIIDATTK